MSNPVADPLPETSAIATDSAIDNELSSYRAFHPAAFVALACGVVAALSFVHWGFYIFAAIGVLFGILAMKRISRDPEIYTGKSIARAGIALCLIFGLAAASRAVADGFVRDREAAKFGREIAKVLADEPIERAIWYRLSAGEREATTPEAMMKQMREPGPGGATMYEQLAAPLMQIRDRLDETDSHSVEFDEVLSSDVVGLDPVAAVTLIFHPKGWSAGHGHSHDAAEPKPADPPADEKTVAIPKPKHMTKVEEPVYARLILKADVSTGKYRWKIDEVTFPYVKGGAKVEFDDGVDTHGHSH
jgi:hypothetical protein